MIILGLTGGIGAGKSTVSAMFAERGIPVFDYDAEVHQLYDSGSSESEQIFLFFKERLPEATVNAVVDKKIVSDRAFADPELLRDIEIEFAYYLDILLATWLADHKWRMFSPVVMLDVPMLFRMGWQKHCDEVIEVICPVEERKNRVMRRPGMTLEKFNAIVAAQTNLCPTPDFALDTSGEMHETADRVFQYLKFLDQKYNLG